MTDAFVALGQRHREKQAVPPEENRPCRMALPWRSGRLPALPYPPRERQEYTRLCRWL